MPFRAESLKEKSKESNPLETLRACARPVIFETGIPEAPFSTTGTGFIVAYQKSLFVVTARHVVGDYPVSKLLVFPWDRAKQPIRFTNWTFVEVTQGDESDEHASDILIVHAEGQSLSRNDARKSQTLIFHQPKAEDWFRDRFTSKFFLCGYPSIKSSVDYFRVEINTVQMFFSGSYARPTPYSGLCHELDIENPLSLENYTGLSGSPVFCVEGFGSKVRFCGMALRGTVKSGRIHFVEADVILDALHRAQQRVSNEAIINMGTKDWSSRHAKR